MSDESPEPTTETPIVEDTTPEGGEPESARPEWLPEKFWNAEEKAPSVENLAKSYAELEKTRGKDVEQLKSDWENERIAARPESPDKYELPKSDLLDEEALAASPIVGVWREAAHSAGLNQEAFNEVIEKYATTEAARIAETREAEMQALGENAKARTEAVGLWASKTFDEQELQAIAQVATTAAGVKALEKMMGGTMDSSSTESGDEDDTPGVTEADIRKLMARPEYYDPKRRDPAVVKQVEDFYAKAYGGKK